MAESIGLTTLSFEQVVKICEAAETAARRFIFSKVPRQKIVDLDITVDILASKPFVVDVDIDIALSHLVKKVDVNKLIDAAVDRALQAAENTLRELIGANTKNSKNA
jgi:hypothetical protein